MTQTPSMSSRQPASAEPFGAEDLGSYEERVVRLAAAQDALMGRLWRAAVEDVERLDVVADRFVLTGDLDIRAAGMSRRERLAAWVATGAEWYLDCRTPEEAAGEREFLAEHAPHIRYIHAPTDDDGIPKGDRKSTRLNSSHIPLSRMPSSA